MAITPEQARAELARRRTRSSITPEQAKAELARRRRGPSLLNSAADAINSTGIPEAMGTAMEMAPYAVAAINPVNALGAFAARDFNRLSGQLGEQTAEYAGSKGAPPTLGATLGMAASLAPSMALPFKAPGVAPRTIINANVPASRAPIIAAAEREGIKPTLAQKTGSKLWSGVESFLEKTPLGGSVLEEFAGKNAAALEKYKGKTSSTLGTPLENRPVGQRVQQGIAKSSKEATEIKNQLFSEIPDDVFIEAPQFKKVADQIVLEQKDALPGYGNPEVLGKAQGAQAVDQFPSSGSGVPRDANYGSMSPDVPVGGKPNYQVLKNARETLNGKIASETTPSGQLTKAGRDYIRLRDALDKDIQAFADKSDSPLEGMINSEFGKSFKKANAYDSARRKIFDNPDIVSATKAYPEDVVGSIFQKNNPSEIDLLRKATDEEGFNLAKRRFTQNILDSDNPARELKKYSPETLRSIFWDPKELQQLQEYIGVRDLGKTVTGLQGTQGSARSNIQGGQYAGLGAGVTGLMTGNIPLAIAGTAQFIAPRVLSKAYLAASEGLRTPQLGVGSTTAIVKSVTGSAAKESRKGLISAFVTRLGRQRLTDSQNTRR